MKTAYEQIKEQLDDMGEDDLIQAHNLYTREYGGHDEIIDMDSFEDYITDVWAAFRHGCQSDNNPSDAYFTFDGYANVQTFNNLSDANAPTIDTDDIATWLEDNDTYLDELNMEIITYTDYTPSEFWHQYYDVIGGDNFAPFIDAIIAVCTHYDIEKVSDDEFIIDGTPYDAEEMAIEFIDEISESAIALLIGNNWDIESVDATLQDEMFYVEA